MKNLKLNYKEEKMKTVLMVENNDIINDVIEKILKQSGYIPCVVKDVENALNCLNEVKFDVVIVNDTAA